jgi:hypothetical protein
MRYGMLILVMMMSGILIAGKFEASVKALFEDNNNTMLHLVFTDVAGSSQLDHLSSEIIDQSDYKLLHSYFDHSKMKGELFVASTKKVSVDDVELLILSLGFRQIEYKGEVIKTEALSEVYQPVIPVEFLNRTRN